MTVAALEPKRLCLATGKNGEDPTAPILLERLRPFAAALGHRHRHAELHLALERLVMERFRASRTERFTACTAAS